MLVYGQKVNIQVHLPIARMKNPQKVFKFLGGQAVNITGKKKGRKSREQTREVLSARLYNSYTLPKA